MVIVRLIFRFSPVFQPFLLAKVQIMLEKYSIMLF